MELFQPWHLIIVAVVLPELGKGLGEGLRGFKDGMKGVTEEVNKAADTSSHTVTPKAEEPVK
jgi:sec-independent protein translocase protein TatA